MNEKIQECINTHSFCEVKNIIDADEMKNFDDVNELVNSLMKVYNFEKNKLPYHINILDLLWANENAHSRIFAELLKQKSGNRFEILESFNEYLTEINPKSKIIPNRPEITSEKGRIDLLILDIEYALIIENKIHNAVDQESQIARYIVKVKQKGYKENQIFIVYLSRDGNKELAGQSWSLNGIDYKERFLERYFPLSFMNDIMPWIKNIILPNCKVKDVYLKSTLEQYVDYLEGMFNVRKIQFFMNSELQDHIKQVLDLNSTPEKNLFVLENKLAEIIKVEDQINILKQAYENECWIEWLKRLKLDFPKYQIFDFSKEEKYKKIGVILCYKGMSFSVLIEKEMDIYFGIGKHESSSENIEDLKFFLNPFIEGFNETVMWYGVKDTTFQDGYRSLKSLIEEIEVFL
jgi:hypothetical protein